jgi:aminoglycoside phosphotransferase (APT) family kinase protein
VSEVTSEDATKQLAAWFEAQLPGSRDLSIEGMSRVEFGHSAEMLILTILWRADGEEHGQDVVVRLRPPSPGLLEPYDLRRQFHILRALETTTVRAPRALWIEETGDVLGRPFYVMERLEGEVYERALPDALAKAPKRLIRMSEAIFRQIAAVHQVDLVASGLEAIGSGEGYLDRELEHWEGEMRRWQRGELPALEHLLATLRDREPAPTPVVTLVHGDPKPGNFAFVGDEVSGVFDWELATLGDPLADIGWAEMTWRITPAFAGLPATHFDENVVRYEEQTGIKIHDREWYGAFQAYKMAVIQLVGAMLFDRGFSDDKRLADMSRGVQWLTQLGLSALGIKEQFASGPVGPREERLQAVQPR